jgi:hypothetical protein
MEISALQQKPFHFAARRRIKEILLLLSLRPMLTLMPFRATLLMKVVAHGAPG